MPIAYLPVADYVARYGEQEAIRLTFERPSPETDPPTVPARDDAKIEAAIIDQEEIVEGYVSRRYPLPLPEVPRIMLTWVATLTREALHVTRPTPEVTAAADRTRAQLKEVAQGLFKLLVEDGSETTTVGGEQLAMTSGDAADPTFSRPTMDEYMDLGRGSGAGAWRS